MMIISCLIVQVCYEKYCNFTHNLDINNVVVTKLLDRFPVVLISIPLSSEWGVEPPFPKQAKYYLPVETEKDTCVAK